MNSHFTNGTRQTIISDCCQQKFLHEFETFSIFFFQSVVFGARVDLFMQAPSPPFKVVNKQYGTPATVPYHAKEP